MVLMVVAAAAWFLLARRKVDAALWTLGAGMWGYITVASLFLGGVNSTVIIVYPVVILMAGWLTGASRGMAFAYLSVAATLGFVILERLGFLPTPFETSPEMRWLVQAIVIMFSAVVTSRMVGSYGDRLQEANRLAKEISRRSAELEATESILRAAQSIAKVGSWVYAFTDNSLQFSAEAGCIFRLPKGASPSLDDLFSMINCEDRSEVDQSWQAVLERDIPFDSEHRIVAAETTRWVRQKVELMRGPDGTPLRAIGTVQDITERKKAESALRESEEKFAKAFRSSPLFIAISTVDDGRYIDVNENFLKTLGHSRAEIIGNTSRNISLWKRPEDRQRAIELLQENGGLFNFEAELCKKSGEVIYCEIWGEPITVDGEACVIWVNSEITERKQTELALRESEERYRVAFLTSPDAINIIRLADDVYLEVNEGFTRHVGWAQEEIIGKTARELYLWRNKSDRRRLAEALQRDGYCENLEADFVAKDGRIIRGLMSAHLMTIKGEACLLSVTRDITDRITAEAQIRKLSLAVEQSPESVVITNLNAEIEYVNEAFVQNTGYNREEVMGKNPRILQSGKTPPETFDSLWDAMTHGRPWHGLFYNRRKDGSEFVEHAVITPIRDPDETITHYVAVNEDITAKKAADDQITTLAFFDPLTQLPNRRLLLDRLKHALASSARSKRYGALLFIDLDNFKTLNDTLGHDIGDLLLQQVALRLTTCVREGDTVARLGGDEFVVMLEDLRENMEESAAQTKTVGEKVLLTLNQPYQLASYLHHSTPSIGVTLFSDQQETIDELLKRADLAMYQAKAAGRNTLRFFDPEMQAVVTARAALEADLREAVLKGQFLLHYQAQVVGEGRVIGVEVLLRWHHPNRGMVLPADFIPLAEDTGLILPIGHWVLQTVCAQLAAWARRPEMAHLTIAVNVSASQFHRKDFVDQVLTVLDHTGANPQRLKLELTESLLVDDVESVISKMAALKMKGVGFSLDDFGTGYSSLSYLKRLPLDQLKIDQGFVRDILTDPNDAAIAKMVIILAESLGLSVIAEGVEIDAQRDFLARHGCHAYQGYFFSRPIPLEAFEELALKD